MKSNIKLPKYKVGDLIYAKIGRQGRKYVGTILAIKYHWIDSMYDIGNWLYKVPKESHIDYVSEEEIIELLDRSKPLKQPKEDKVV